MNFTVVLAARWASDRLPGKALADVCGKPALWHLFQRFRACDRLERIVVCLSPDPADAPIAALCEAEGVPYHLPGAETAGDVVAQFDGALREHAPDARMVFRGLVDMQFVEPYLLDWRADLLARTGADLAWPGSVEDPPGEWPVYGSRESPWSRAAWDECARCSQGVEREHPGEYVYRHLRRFRVAMTERLRDEYYLPFRLEMDTERDLEVVRAIYAALWDGERVVPTLAAMRWLAGHPEVAALNSGVELKTITQVDARQRRGQRWRCPACGAYPMLATVIVRQGLETECPECGETVRFREIPAFLAEREKR